ncbi:response regulator [Cecembia sp.]|uniref:response regulator n=1 Tax=Cecembia sp. TaxID=1898110 RepID=UPI0025BD64A0|nr:response regulator [Cecembia sp.]
MKKLNDIPAILLIDEEEIVNMINKTVIRRTGYQGEIMAFQSGQEGFNFIEKLVSQNGPTKHPYLLLLDLKMPGFSGWDFLNKFLSLKESDRKQFKIAILTSSDKESDIEESNKYKEVLQFSFKPLTKHSFLKIIDAIQN